MSPVVKRYGPPALWILVYLAAGMLIGAATSDSVSTWYQTLAKPALNPPPVVFPIVWSALYVMMGLAGWLLWQQRNAAGGKLALGLFGIQTLMNWEWSFIFFQWHMLGTAYVWILAMVAVVGILIFAALKVSRTAALLLLPYLAWIGFASYLSGSIWVLNQP